MLATGGGFGLGVLEVYSGLLNPCRTLWCAKRKIQKPRFAVERTEGSLVQGQLCKKQESHAMQAVSEQLHLASHGPGTKNHKCDHLQYAQCISVLQWLHCCLKLLPMRCCRLTSCRPVTRKGSPGKSDRFSIRSELGLGSPNAP